MLASEFKSTVLETEMRDNGFVLIPNLFDGDEVAHMLQIYLKHHTARNEQFGMWNSLYNTPSDIGMQISEELLAILKPKFEQLFVSYHTPVATFMSKNGNENSITPLHRDYSIVDEQQFQYRNIWIPLIDTTVQNGALYVLRGSNKVFTYPLPFGKKWPYLYMVDQLFLLTETVLANAGDCVIYADKTLHGSFINRTDTSRPTVHLGSLHPDFELLFNYYSEKDNEVRAYRVPNDFYFKNDFSEPVGRYPLQSSYIFQPPHLDFDTVAQQLKTLAPNIT